MKIEGIKDGKTVELPEVDAIVIPTPTGSIVIQSGPNAITAIFSAMQPADENAKPKRLIFSPSQSGRMIVGVMDV